MTRYFVGSELTRIPSAHSRSIGSREFSIEYIVVGFGHRTSNEWGRQAGPWLQRCHGPANLDTSAVRDQRVSLDATLSCFPVVSAISWCFLIIGTYLLVNCFTSGSFPLSASRWNAFRSSL